MSVAAPSDETFSSGDYVAVLLPMPFDEAFDYQVPPEMTLRAGDFVQVPFGPHQRIGVVWCRAAPDDEVIAKVKPVGARLEITPLSAPTMDFIAWVARYTMAPLGNVLRMATGSPRSLAPPKPIIAYRHTGDLPPRMTEARSRVLGLLQGGLARTGAELAEAAAVSASVIKGLVAAGTLQAVELPPDFNEQIAAPDPDHDAAVKTLSAGQTKAVATLAAKFDAQAYSCTLLEGVTGSGKTEVYLELIAHALRTEPALQVLVLVPEIALTNQLLARFEERFGARPLAWHSGLSTRDRRVAWRAIAAGKARLVVGARSALMLPYAHLGLLVVDEEHDPSYKQEEQVIYHARDMAVVRASLGGFPAVLVSATPALETVVNCERGRYGRVHLPERHGGAVLPEITTIDMRREELPSGQWLSPALIGAIGDTLAQGEQTLLFLNRRGYAPAAICRACGHRLQREGCSAPLVVHRYGKRLQCHHCSYSIPMPSACPQCGAEHAIVVCGPGVERLAEETLHLFPDARIGIMASDTVRSAREVQAFIEQIERHEIDIIIGTQLVAKGHHFPMLTLVGIIDADLGLSGGDLRAAERTYQQLWQVAGRAGRAERNGQVLLQTYMPEHPVMQALAAGDGPGFYAREAQERKAWGLPPFGRLAAIILSGKNSGAVADAARRLERTIPPNSAVTVMGPAPAPFAVLRGRHRYRFLVKADRDFNIQHYLKHWLPPQRETGGVRITVDIDPYSFL